MKILLVSNMYPNYAYPNYGIFVKNTENILLEENNTIEKIIMNKKADKIRKIISYLLFYAKIFFHVYFKKYDIIYVHYAAHCSLPFLALKKIKKKINIVVNVHGSDIIPQNLIQKKFQKYVGRFLSISDKVVVPSEYYKKIVNKKYSISTDKIYVFPSGGINASVFYPIIDKIKLFKELNLNSKYRYIGYVGRIDIKKGWNTFLEALGLLNYDGFFLDKRVIIVGSGSQEHKLKEAVHKLGLEKYIIKYDLQAQKELNKLYNSMDLLCFPSESESLGLVGIEAMTCGIPVIGSNIPAIKEYLFSGVNGFIFKLNDTEDLSKKIKYYFSKDNNYIKEMRENAIKTSENYNSQYLNKKLMRILFNK